MPCDSLLYTTVESFDIIASKSCVESTCSGSRANRSWNMTVSITCSINIGTTAILVCGRKSVTYACRIYEPWNWVPVLSRWPIQTFRKQGRLFHFFAHHALLESAIALHTSGRQMSETKHLLVLDISYLKAPQQHTLCEAQHATVSETC